MKILYSLFFSIILISFPGNSMASEFYEFEFKKINDGTRLPLSDFKGKVVIIFNAASLCGFTKQYAEFETLWQKYKDKGLVVIAVPSNDFGKQEPGNNEEIQETIVANFNPTFFLTEKVNSVGEDSHPFFNWSREQFGWLSGPKWNFYKYIIDGDGKPVAWFSSLTSPTSHKIIDIIEKLL